MAFFFGQIILFAGNFTSQGRARCDGQLHTISQYPELFGRIGTTYGGDGRNTFALPDLRGRLPVGHGQGPGLTHRVLGEMGGQHAVTLTVEQLPSHCHKIQASSGQASSTSPADQVLASVPAGHTFYLDSPSPLPAGVEPKSLSPHAVDGTDEGGGHPNQMPGTVISYLIAVDGCELATAEGTVMQPFLGEIRAFPYNFAPDGWSECNGQILPIQQNPELFALLGYTYGGNASTATFALPNLSGRTAVGDGTANAAAGSDRYTRGQSLGSPSVAIDLRALPSHSHSINTLAISYKSFVQNHKSNPTRDVSWPSRYFDTKGGAVARASYHPRPTAMGFVEPSQPVPMARNMLAPSGGSQPHENRQPYLVVRYCIATRGYSGLFGSRG